VQVLQNFWLSIWSEATAAHRVRAKEDSSISAFPSTYYMLIYFSMGLASLVFSVARAVTCVFATLNASQSLHDNLLQKLLSLPMSFFDTQPSGRLVNRFTKDVEACDIQMQQTISSFTTCLTTVVLSICVVGAITRGSVLVALIPLLFFYSVVQRYYLATSRELKRLDSIAMSPIFSSFSETLAGLATVRAFGRQSLFARRNEELMDASNRAWWPIQIVNRWLSIRLELMGQTMVLGTALFVTLFISDAGLAGLAITSALSIVGLMNWGTRQTTELEMGMNSVERMTEYLAYESERPAIVEGNRYAFSGPAMQDWMTCSRGCVAHWQPVPCMHGAY
jgi:ABC-type multidrug transport system fused ATPase/permease subunit